MKPKYSLHVHTSWRLYEGGDIRLSQGAMFANKHGFRWHEDNRETIEELPFAGISRELNELFETEAIHVTKIEANEQGDLKLYLERDYCLEVFVDSIGDTESWRFFEANGENGHFVVFDEEDDTTC